MCRTRLLIAAFIAVFATGCDRPPADPSGTPDDDDAGIVARGGDRAGQTGPAPEDHALPDFAGLFERFGPSVVNISATHPLPVPERYMASQTGRPIRPVAHSLGSGFALDQTGHIVTCASVIQDADQLHVILHNGQKLTARLVASDPDWDLAVLAIDEKTIIPPLTPAPAHSLRTGDWVAAFGYPFGLSHSITAGTVSALRPADELPGPHGLITTDAAVNPGCNGGPLLDISGHLVGINLIPPDAEPGAGLAIPIHDAWPVLEQLVKGQPSVRPWLGWSLQRLDADLAASFGLSGSIGVLINGLDKDGPASRAGLQIGDICVTLSGHPIRNPIEADRRVRRLPIGEPIRVEVLRQGRRIQRSLAPVPSPQQHEPE